MNVGTVINCALAVGIVGVGVIGFRRLRKELAKTTPVLGTSFMDEQYVSPIDTYLDEKKKKQTKPQNTASHLRLIEPQSR